MSRVIRNSFVIGLVALLACDRPGIVEPRAFVTATFPGVVGNYAATGTATLKTWLGSKTYSCSATIDIPTQSDSSFSGTITVLAAHDCDSQSGTVAGVVSADGSVTGMAYASDGATIWEAGAARSGCTLVSSTPFTGTLSGNTVAVVGRGAYDCPSVFGPYRADADAHVTGTRR